MLWCQIALDHLQEHGFVLDPKESMAETFARALAIRTDELKVYLADGRFVSELKRKFPLI